MKIQSALAMTMALGLLGGACSTTSGVPGAGGNSSTGGSTGAAGSPGAGAPSVGREPRTGRSRELLRGRGSLRWQHRWHLHGGLRLPQGERRTSTSQRPVSIRLRARARRFLASLNVTGTFSALANGTFTDGTTTTGNLTIQLPAGCLHLSGTTVTCSGHQRSARGWSGLRVCRLPTGRDGRRMHLCGGREPQGQHGPDHRRTLRRTATTRRTETS